jgi:integrase/recombinase XerD
LFPVKANGEPISVSNFETNFKKYLLRAELNTNISPHCLRNNFAKRCLMNGMDIFTLSKILGHSSVQVTEQAYLDLTDEDLGRKYANYSPIACLK